MSSLEEFLKRAFLALHRAGLVSATAMKASPRAEACVAAAERLGQGFESTNSLHVLVALLDDVDCGCCRFLRSVGVPLESVRTSAERRLATAAVSDGRDTLKDVLVRAYDVVARTPIPGSIDRSAELHTIHLLWGLVAAPHSEAGELLRQTLPSGPLVERSDLWTLWNDAG